MGSLAFRTDARILVVILMVSMLAAALVGVRMARRRPAIGEVDATMESAIFGLLGLLLAFTFSMAGARYENQRKLIAEEANTIGTATLRSDMFLEHERIGFRADFREYLEARIADQESGSDIGRIMAARERSFAAQKLLWARASRISQDGRWFVASNQMIPALNQMFDAASRRYAAERARVPESIVLLLFVMSVAATGLYTFLAERRQRFEWFTTAAFVVIASSVCYVTIELDRPRRGLIDVHVSEHALVELRALF